MSRTFTLRALGAASLFLFTGTAALAYQPVAGFSTTDANADGFVTFDEAEAYPDLVQSWARLDLDNDGKLSAAEFGTLEPKAAGVSVER
jgi:hypothetical protein